MTTPSLIETLDVRLHDLRDRVVALAEVNSGSFNPDGVNKVGDRLAEFVAEIDPHDIERIPVAPAEVLAADGTFRQTPVGDAFRATKRPDAPFQVCLFGHLDTVFPADSAFQTVIVDGHRLHGPGVADCKGCLVQAIEILRHLDQVSWGDEVGWQLLALPDEEIGSASSLDLLAEAAASANLGLGFEPALPFGRGRRSSQRLAHRPHDCARQSGPCRPRPSRRLICHPGLARLVDAWSRSTRPMG